jgi:hypothetical protein
LSALAHDVDVGALVLQLTAGAFSSKQRVDQRVTGGTIERTMQGASTLTINLDDGNRELLRAGIFDQQVDLQLDGLWWRLVKVSKQGDALTLTFEDRAVSLLRAITKPRKASRAKMTRAEFALSIVREIKTGGGIPFICPDLHTVQKIADSTTKLTAKQRAANVQPGLSTSAKLTVRGAPASTTQKQNAERALDVANSLGASDRATLALMEAVIDESNITNLPGGDADSRGILQVRDSTAGPMRINNRDIEQCCNAFLTRGFTGQGGAITLAAKYPSWTAGQVAQGVQGSATPTRYDTFQQEAQAFVNAYTGGSSSGTLSTTQIKKLPYQFQRGGTSGTIENSWACLQRLAQEVQWACFAADGAIYFVAEGTLIRRKPVVTISEQTLGVDQIDFDIDNGKAKSDATVTARASRYALIPGSCVVLEDCGPANGRWLVSDVQRGIFDASATIMLKRATKALPEPANSTTSVSIGGSSAGAPAGLPDVIARAYTAAQAIDAKRYPYVWGGGHARAGYPDHGVSGHADSAGTIAVASVGYDCSGSTCAVLAAAGMGFRVGGPVDASGAIASSWGQAGEGQTMTIWANAIHVWIEFKTSAGDQHFGTGDWGSDQSANGPAFQSRMHTKGGFTPRHWPST